MPLSWVVGSNTVQHNVSLPSAFLPEDLHNNFHVYCKKLVELWRWMVMVDIKYCLQQDWQSFQEFIINQDKIFAWAKLLLHQIMTMKFNMSCGIVNVYHFPVKSFDLCIELGCLITQVLAF